jgi:hypothetical protein
MQALRLIIAMLILWSPTVSLAQPSASEPEEPSVLEEDPRRPELEVDSPPTGSLWLALTGAFRVADDDSGRASHAQGMLMLGGSIDDVVKGTSVRQHLALAKTQSDEPSPPRDAVPEEPRPRPRGPLARGCVRAAIEAAGIARELDRIDDASTRARVSGLVPELRLRVARVVDEDQSLSPTEYDPERITASGGSSVWIEGRATFRLERLVFADEEVALEKMRGERHKLEREIADDVLRSFAIWQRASGSLATPDIDDETRAKLDIERVVEETRLDVLTNGWFSQNVEKLTR